MDFAVGCGDSEREFERGESEPIKVAQFASEQEFLVAEALLESEGIACFSADLNSRRYLDGMPASITLQVRRSDAELARAILDSPPNSEHDVTGKDAT